MSNTPSFAQAVGKFAVQKVSERFFGPETKATDTESNTSHVYDEEPRTRSSLWYELQITVVQIEESTILSEQEKSFILNKAVLEHLDSLRSRMSTRSVTAFDGGRLKADILFLSSKLVGYVKQKEIEEEKRKIEEEKRKIEDKKVIAGLLQSAIWAFAAFLVAALYVLHVRNPVK